MTRWAPSGVAVYVGIPGSGKTTKALRDLAELTSATGRPALVLDSCAVDELAGVPAVGSVDEAVDACWGEGRHARYVPRDADELNRLLAPALSPGGVNVLLDESHLWTTARSRGVGPAYLPRIMRAHRHAGCWLLLTAQHLSGDVSQEALSCAPRLVVFRCTSPRVLEVLERDWGQAPELVRNLPRYKYLDLRPGF